MFNDKGDGTIQAAAVERVVGDTRWNVVKEGFKNCSNGCRLSSNITPDYIIITIFIPLNIIASISIMQWQYNCYLPQLFLVSTEGYPSSVTYQLLLNMSTWGWSIITKDYDWDQNHVFIMYRSHMIRSIIIQHYIRVIAKNADLIYHAPMLMQKYDWDQYHDDATYSW